MGSAFVAAHVLHRMSRKQASSLRALQSRLHVLALLVADADALAPGGGLAADALAAYCADLGCFGHASGEIRHAAEALFVAVFRRTRAATLLPALLAPHLRPRQVEEYAAAFAAAAAAGGGGAAAAAAAAAPVPAAR